MSTLCKTYEHFSRKNWTFTDPKDYDCGHFRTVSRSHYTMEMSKNHFKSPIPYKMADISVDKQTVRKCDLLVYSIYTPAFGAP